MLSKVADSLYWMSRNVERAENIARLISVNLISNLENFDPEAENHHNWKEIIRINSDLSLFDKYYSEYDKRSAIDFLSFSTLNHNSILYCIELARENAKGVREIIPSEMWEMINSFYWNIKDYVNKGWEPDNITSFLSMIKDESFLFQGIMSATNSRGDAYSFMNLGKYIERLEKMTRILDVYYYKQLNTRFNKEVVNYHHWISVLQSVSGYEPYLRKYRSFISPERVAEFLLFDEDFPRSIHFCISRLMEAFMNLQHGQIESYAKDLNIAIGKLESNLKYTSIEEVLEQGVHQYVQNLQAQCYDIGLKINKTYYLGELES
jgi:uncharacterized alpha-E superfamily protein